MPKTNNIRDLLTGGFTIIGDSQTGFEAERFLIAINHIEEILNLDASDGTIHRQWEQLLREGIE